MIPKIIHYIWVGGNPLPKIVEKCINSWKKYCPDYEIKRWDETNLNLNEYQFAKDAYDARKYAFASDVFRFDILYKEGGIYLDTDVELRKPLDEFLSLNAFSGFESEKSVAPGLICGMEKGNTICLKMLEYYKTHTYTESMQNKETVCTIFTRLLKEDGLKLNNTLQALDDITIYPTDYFCPISFETKECNITDNTYTIHHFAASWVDPPSLFQKLVINVKKIIKKIIGKKNVQKIRERRKKRKIKKENEIDE